MNLPTRAVKIIHTLHARNLDLAHGDDNARRALTRIIAEQLAYELGVDWGTKSTTENHPQSKDAIAFRKPSNLLDIWDWQNGTTREPQVVPEQPPDYSNMPHHFIQVTPFNHIGGEVPVPEPPPNDDKLDEILFRINELYNRMNELQADASATYLKLSEVQQELQAMKPPIYDGRIFGISFTMTPRD